MSGFIYTAGQRLVYLEHGLVCTHVFPHPVSLEKLPAITPGSNILISTRRKYKMRFRLP